MEQLDFLLIFTTDVKTYSCWLVRAVQVLFSKIDPGESSEQA